MTQHSRHSTPQPILSLQNPKIKGLVRLMTDKSERCETRSFALEGAREISRALTSGLSPLACFLCPSLIGPDAQNVLDQLHTLVDPHLGGPFYFTITESIFEKVALRTQKDGLMVVFRAPAILSPNSIVAQKSPDAPPLYLGLQGIEKPGNIGAILRSADAVGVNGIFLVTDQDPTSVDLYHPHLMRNSLGGVFSQRLAVIKPYELAPFCRSHGITLMAAALSSHAENLYHTDLRTPPLLLLMGSESSGISPELIKECDKLVQIPMQGICDSLNVNAATAVILYEILRQRNIKP